MCANWGEPAQSAKDGQQDTMHNTFRFIRDKNVTQFTVKPSSYTNATTGYLIV